MPDHRRVRSPVTVGSVDDQLVVEARHRRTAGADHRRHDPDRHDQPLEADGSAIAGAATGGELGPDIRVPGQVTADPWLALPEEFDGAPLAIRPPSAGRRDRDHDATLRVDDDAKPAGPRRVAQRVREGAAGQHRDRGSLRRRHGGHGSSCGPPFHPARRSSDPASSPVSCPAIIARRPLTTTCSMPHGVTRRLLVRGRVGDGRRVEDDEIREGTLQEHAPVAQSEAGRGHAGQLGDRPSRAPACAVPARRCRASEPWSRRCAGAVVPHRGSGDPAAAPRRRCRHRSRAQPGSPRHRPRPCTRSRRTRPGDRQNQRVQGQVGRIRAKVRTKLGQRAPRPIRVTRGERDPDARPARIHGHILPARDPALHLGDGTVPDPVVGERGDALLHAETPAGSAAGSSRGSSRPPCTGTGPRPTSSPSARALSRTATASAARPHTARAPHLRCDTWSRDSTTPPSRTARIVPIDSASDANSPAASFRMWVAYSPPRRVAAVTSTASSSGVGVKPRGVDQPRREPEGARVERHLHLRHHHRRELGVGRDRRLGPHHRAADGPVADQERDVQPERLGVDRVEVLAERAPPCRQPVLPERQVDELPPGIGDGCERVAAVPGELGREPLTQMADEGAIDEQRPVGVSVRIDEPGRDDEPAGVDHLCDVTDVHRPQSSIARFRSPRTPTSARRPGDPAPSTTVPPRSRRSKAVTH